MVGTTRLGFMARYSSVKPNLPAMSRRSNGTPISVQPHNSFSTLDDVCRPQIININHLPRNRGELNDR